MDVYDLVQELRAKLESHVGACKTCSSDKHNPYPLTYYCQSGKKLFRQFSMTHSRWRNNETW